MCGGIELEKIQAEEHVRGKIGRLYRMVRVFADSLVGGRLRWPGRRADASDGSCREPTQPTRHSRRQAPSMFTRDGLVSPRITDDLRSAALCDVVSADRPYSAI